MKNFCLALILTLAWNALPSLGMRCSRIDLLVLDGSGLLLHDDTVLAIDGKPLKIGCYCGNNPNTMVEWLKHKYTDSPVPVWPSYGTTDLTRMAIEDGYQNQSVCLLHLDSVTASNTGVYVCRDQSGFMQRTVDIRQLGDGLRSFLGEGGPEPSYFLSKLNFLNNIGILAGAMDRLYLLDAELRLKNNTMWLPNATHADTCRSYIHDRPHYTCRNHIRFYHPVPENRSATSPMSLIVCGTGAFFPRCTIMEDINTFELDWRNLHVPDSGIILQHPDLTGYQQFRNSYPGDPILLSAQHRRAYMERYGFAFHNIIVSNGTMGRHHIEDMGPSVDVLSDKIHWMRAPVAFVDGYSANYDEEDDEPGSWDFFFIFFHENAFEIRVGDPRIYSRVARVCKNDEGFVDGKAVVFDSYVKARIACLEESNYKDVTKPGAVDYYYNVVRKVKMVRGSYFKPKEGRTDRIVYGAFTGDRLGPAGSAICVYNASRGHRRENNNGIFDIFKRDYLDVNTPYRRTISNLNPFDCSQERPAEKAKSENLIYAMVQQIGDFPLVKLNDVTVISMEVDQTWVRREGELKMQDVIFIGTDTGEVRKIFVVPFNENPFYKAETVETLTLEPHSFVHHLELKTKSDMSSLSEKMLFANTNSSIFRLPLHRCSRFTDCTECVSAKDPYCFWSINEVACVPLPANQKDVNISDYLQDVDTGDYTRFPQCKVPRQCTDMTDCEKGDYCSIKDRKHFPAPIQFFTGKMREVLLLQDTFQDSWTIFTRFELRRKNNRVVLHVSGNAEATTLKIDVRPGSRSIRVTYSIGDSSTSTRRVKVQDFERFYHGVGLALSYQHSSHNFTLYFNHQSDEWIDRRTTFPEQEQERTLTLGSSPDKDESLANKVTAFLYVPGVLPKTEMNDWLLLGQTPVGKFCQAKPNKQ